MRSRSLNVPKPGGFRPKLWDPESFGSWSERFARYMGTSRFLVQMTAFIVVWLAWNSLAPSDWRFDPYTFTFLTLLLSLQASYAAPLILLAQNRQDDRDRVESQQDRARAAMGLEINSYLTRELAQMQGKLNDLAVDVDRIRRDGSKRKNAGTRKRSKERKELDQRLERIEAALTTLVKATEQR